MENKLCSDLIYHVSNYLNTKDKLSYLQTEREAIACYNLPIFKKYIAAIRIERWWKKLIIPCINGDRLSYKISLATLIKKWSKFTNRQIQFLSGGIISHRTSMPIIYTVTCDETLAKNSLSIRFPGSVNTYSLFLNKVCKYENINRVGEVVEFEIENIITESLHVMVR